jgi:translation elongation factor EF-1beta
MDSNDFFSYFIRHGRRNQVVIAIFPYSQEIKLSELGNKIRRTVINGVTWGGLKVAEWSKGCNQLLLSSTIFPDIVDPKEMMNLILQDFASQIKGIDCIKNESIELFPY